MADKKITPGIYTYGELVDLAGVDLDKSVEVENADGSIRVDFRRINVGGLTFDHPDNTIVVGEDSESVEVRVEGKLEGKLSVDKKADFRAASDLPDSALLIHTDDQGTRHVQKSELEF